jgi:DedD protein
MAEPADINVDELRRRARRRLIGAIVLALGAAVIVPMLLESEPKPLGEDVAVKIPPVDDGKFVNRLSGTTDGADNSKGARRETKEPPAVEAPPKKSVADAEKAVVAPAAKAPKYDTTVAPDQAPASDAAAVANAVPTAPVEAAPPPKTDATPTVTESKPPASAKVDPAKGGFAVQLAAFSDDKGASALASRLKKSGYPAYTEPLKTTRGTLWRVRVGPYPSHEIAIGTRNKLKAEGQNGIVASVHN